MDQYQDESRKDVVTSFGAPWCDEDDDHKKATVGDRPTARRHRGTVSAERARASTPYHPWKDTGRGRGLWLLVHGEALRFRRGGWGRRAGLVSVLHEEARISARRTSVRVGRLGWCARTQCTHARGAAVLANHPRAACTDLTPPVVSLPPALRNAHRLPPPPLAQSSWRSRHSRTLHLSTAAPTRDHLATGRCCCCCSAFAASSLSPVSSFLDSVLHAASKGVQLNHHHGRRRRRRRGRQRYASAPRAPTMRLGR